MGSYVQSLSSSDVVEGRFVSGILYSRTLRRVVCIEFSDYVTLVLLSVLNLSTWLNANVLCLLATTLDFRS